METKEKDRQKKAGPRPSATRTAPRQPAEERNRQKRASAGARPSSGIFSGLGRPFVCPLWADAISRCSSSAAGRIPAETAAITGCSPAVTS